MEPKKSTKADLENKRSVFMMVGFVAALLIILYAFKTGSRVTPASTFGGLEPVQVVEEVIPPTMDQEKKQINLPPPPKIIEFFTEVNDEWEIDEVFTFTSTDISGALVINELPKLRKEEEVEDTIFRVVEQMPLFPGGDKALIQWIGRNVHYPEVATANGDQGTVYVQFVVGKDGMVTDTRVLRTLSPALDQEALRVINKMPRWEPGRQRGKPVRVSYTVPIRFQLN